MELRGYGAAANTAVPTSINHRQVLGCERHSEPRDSLYHFRALAAQRFQPFVDVFDKGWSLSKVSSGGWLTDIVRGGQWAHNNQARPKQALGSSAGRQGPGGYFRRRQRQETWGRKTDCSGGGDSWIAATAQRCQPRFFSFFSPYRFPCHCHHHPGHGPTRMHRLPSKAPLFTG